MPPDESSMGKKLDELRSSFTIAMPNLKDLTILQGRSSDEYLWVQIRGAGKLTHKVWKRHEGESER